MHSVLRKDAVVAARELYSSSAILRGLPAWAPLGAAPPSKNEIVAIYEGDPPPAEGGQYLGGQSNPTPPIKKAPRVA